MTDMGFVLDAVTSVGFPIAVCVYLLYERDKTTKALIGAIHNLELVIRGKQ